MQVELPSPAALKLLISDFPEWDLAKWAEILHKARTILNTYGKFPSVAQLYSLGQPSEDEIGAECRLAWEQMLNYKKRYCGCNEGVWYASPEYPAPMRIERAVRLLGGWTRIAQMLPADAHFVQKDFFEHYKSYTAMCELDLDYLGIRMGELKLLGERKKM